MPRTAVYAGTFDPPTLGHLWMIEQASRLFDHVIVAIGINPEKKTLFSLDERLEMLRQTVGALHNVSVSSYVNQYLIHYATSVNAGFIIRGIRNVGDYEYEKAMRNINGDLGPGIATVFLMPPREIAEIASSVVKGLIGPAGWERVVFDYVPEGVFKKLLASRHSLWRNLASLGARGDESAFWDGLLTPYMDAARAYHNWQHIADMLAGFETIKDRLRDPVAVEMAIWFHDVVYDPKKKDNEEQSAEIAVSVAKNLGLPDAFAGRVGELIRATKHAGIPDDADARYLVDLDLAILGQPARAFDAYEAAIRKESAWVPDEQFAAGRGKILRAFLDRPTIFGTECFRERYEGAARENLKLSIEALKQG